jgi:hypothetical protein
VRSPSGNLLPGIAWPAVKADDNARVPPVSLLNSTLLPW